MWKKLKKFRTSRTVRVFTRKVSNQPPIVEKVSFVVTLCTIALFLLTVVSFWELLISSFENWKIMLPLQFLGFLFFLLLFSKSLCQDYHSIQWPAKRLECGQGQKDEYRHLNLLDVSTGDVMIIGPNLHGSLVQEEVREKLVHIVTEQSGYVTLILGTKKVFEAVYGGNGIADMKTSLENLRDIYVHKLKTDEQKKRFRVVFVGEVGTLSATIRDQNSNDVARSIAVLNPRWGKELNPDERLYCVIEKWEYPELFGYLVNQARFLDSHPSCYGWKGVYEMCQEFGVAWNGLAP